MRNTTQRIKRVFAAGGILLAVIILQSGMVKAANYYWVGGTGNWTDYANHWATTSGGSVFHTSVPGPNDDVFFDNNSFLSSGIPDTIFAFMPTPQCRNFTFFNPTPVPVAGFSSIGLGGPGSLSLEVYGSIDITGSLPNTPLLNLPYFVLLGSGNSNYIKSDNNQMGFQMYTTTNGTYTLMDDFSGFFLVQNGFLNTNNKNINIDGFLCRIEQNGFVDFTTSIVTSTVDSTFSFECGYGASMKADSAVFDLSATSFKHSNGVVYPTHIKEIKARTISLANDTVEHVLVYGYLLNFSGCYIGQLDVNSYYPTALQTGNINPNDNHIKKLNINCHDDCFFITDSASGNFNATCHVDSFQINSNFFPSIHIRISSGDTIYINDDLSNANFQALYLESTIPGQACFIYKASGLVCLSNIYLQDVHAIGGAVFSAGGANANNGNNTGWQFSACSLAITNCNVSPGWNVWTGNYSNDWNESLNWCNGVPSASDNVLIAADVDTVPGIQAPLYQPEIKGNNASCRKLKIENPNNLSIYGINNSSLNVNDSLIIDNNSGVKFLVNDTFQISNGTIHSPLASPFNATSRQRVMQLVYSSMELSSYGLIPGASVNELGFLIYNRASTLPYDNFTISYYYTTPGFCFSGAAPAVAPVLSAGGQIYSGPAPLLSSQIPGTSGIYNLPLTNPLVWNGSDLVIQISYSLPVNDSLDESFVTMNLGCRISLYAERNDSTPISLPSLSNAQTIGTSTSRANIIFYVSNSLSKPQLNISGQWINNGNFDAGNSLVNFNGVSQQNISGTSNTLFRELQIDNPSGVVQNTSVTVDDTLWLTNGDFILNGKTLTINNGGSGAITSVNGHLLSEDLPPNYGLVNWKIGNIPGSRSIPFADTSGFSIPFIFFLSSGTSDLIVGTYHASIANTPLPSGVTNINNSSGTDNSANMIDRYWLINENGTAGTANITFTCSASEMTGFSNVKSQRWDGSFWKSPVNPASQTTGVTSNFTPGISQFNSVWVLTDAGSLMATNDYYWVGGTGNWNDVSHWATTSGGSVFHSVPPYFTDDVYFDNNSFVSNSDTVYSSPSYNRCNSVQLNSVFTPFLPGFTVTSNVDLQSLVSNPYLNIHFAGTGTNNTIHSGGNTLDLQFDSIGTWHLQDDFTGEILLLNGTIYTHGYDVNITNNNLMVDYYGSIYLGSSTVNINAPNSFLFSQPPADIYGDSASFFVNGLFSHYSGVYNHRFKYINAQQLSLAYDTVETVIFNDSVFYISGNHIGTVEVNGTGAFPEIVSDYNNGSDDSYFGKCIINGSGCFFKTDSFFGNPNATIHFDTLLIANPTCEIIISDGDTLYINDALLANYSTGNVISIHSATPGQPCYISKTTGTVCLDYLDLKDVHAIGGAAFYAGANSVDNGNNTGWQFTNCAGGLAYYWVGGTGNWSDVAHWATTSGGTNFYTSPPGTIDDVYFDGNSFTGVNDSVYVSGNVNCNSFNYSATTGSISSLADTIFVYGSLNATGTGNFSYPDLTFSLRGAAQGNGITSNSNILNLFFHDSTSGSWAFNDDFEGDLNINNGTIDFGNNNFHLLNSVSFDKGSIDLDHSIIQCDNGFSINSAQVIGGQATIYVDSLFSHINLSAPAKFKYLEAYQVFIGYDSVEQMVVNYRLFADKKVNVNTLIFSQNADLFSSLDGSVPANKNKFNKVIAYPYHLDISHGGGGGSIIIDSLICPVNVGLHFTTVDTLIINDYLFFNSAYYYGLSSSTANTTFIYNGAPLCLKNTTIANMIFVGPVTADTSCMDGGGNTGITFAPCNNFSDVWPGDANYDLIANNNDILNIGLAYGDTGLVRAGASLNWTAQPAGDWNYFFQNLANHKHADCDGNGLVDNNDTTAITLNYGLTHPARLASGNNLASLTDPTFYLEVSPDSASLSDTVDVNMYLGTSAIPVDSIYGIAFTVDIDTSYVDTTYMTFDYIGTWLGTPGNDLLTYHHTRFSQSAVDFAFTRIDHNNTGGFGYLGKIGVVIVDNVDARVSVPFVLKDVYAITASEYELALNLQTGWVSVDTTTTGIKNNDINRDILVFPNPAKNKVVVISKENSISGFELTDQFGRIIQKETAVFNQKSFTISSPGKGCYILKLFTGQGIAIRKVVFLE